MIVIGVTFAIPSLVVNLSQETLSSVFSNRKKRALKSFLSLASLDKYSSSSLQCGQPTLTNTVTVVLFSGETASTVKESVNKKIL